jgi:hypothetical protein
MSRYFAHISGAGPVKVWAGPRADRSPRHARSLDADRAGELHRMGPGRAGSLATDDRRRGRAGSVGNRGSGVPAGRGMMGPRSSRAVSDSSQ